MSALSYSISGSARRRSSVARAGLRISVFLFLSAGIACGEKGTEPLPLSPSGNPIEVHAHRGGGALRPENSLVAFGVAISEVGSDAIELDLHQTSDRHIIIHHDYLLNPKICLDLKGRHLSNPPTVSSLSLAEIQKYDCGTLVGLKKGTPLPTLEEVFDTTQDLTTPRGALANYDLHLKWDATTISAADFASLIMKVVQDRGLLARVSFMNENPDMLNAVRALEPGAKIIYLAGKLAEPDFTLLAALKADAVAPIGDLLDPKAAKRVRDMGIKLLPWIVNSPSEWTSLFKIGVDGIITDNPLGLREMVDGSSITISPSNF